MKKVAAGAFLFAVISISIILYRSATRQVLVDDEENSASEKADNGGGYTVLIDDEPNAGWDNALVIPLPKGVTADGVIFEDRYTGREFDVYIDSRDESFYKNNSLHTDLDMIDSAFCRETDSQGGVCLAVKLDGIYAADTSFPDENHILVRFSKPSERFEHIVVIDPAGGGKLQGTKGNGLSEKNITLETALLLKELSDNDTASDIKLYVTRLNDRSLGAAERSRLADDLEAELYVELAASESSDPEINGVLAVYNDRFFLREMTNAQWAGILEQNVAGVSGASALGVEVCESEESSVLKVKVPAASVSLGYLTGNKDGKRLQNEEYKMRLARGIYEAIKEACKETE